MDERKKPSNAASSSEYLLGTPAASGPAPSDMQRRKWVRFSVKGVTPSVRKKTFLEFLNKADNRAKALYDLSEGGARVLVTERFVPGTKVHFEMEVKAFKDKFESHASVVWCAPYAYREGEFIVGLRFDDISAAQKRQIEGMRSYFNSPHHKQKEETRFRNRPPPDISKIEFKEPGKE
jgi:c-di-GMP-binding flagellar brake protein YcgR